eukprot:1797678-Alexandrium_andersonii.AAC.1
MLACPWTVVPDARHDASGETLGVGLRARVRWLTLCCVSCRWMPRYAPCRGALLQSFLGA